MKNGETAHGGAKINFTTLGWSTWAYWPSTGLVYDSSVLEKQREERAMLELRGLTYWSGHAVG